MRDVEEVVPVAELSAVPGAPSFLEGFLNVGGELVGVVSLRRLMGLPSRPWELYTPLVILRSAEPKVAIEIDGVVGVSEISDDALNSAVEGSTINSLATGVARIDGRAVVLLSTERILLEAEQKRVAELAEQIRRRLSEVTAETE